MASPSSRFVVAVVDNDPSVLRSIEDLLESADYDARLYASGADLLASGTVADIDCLISDIDMPDMDGFQLLQQVHVARPGLPTILITGYPDRLKHMPPLGAFKPRLFTKPFQAAELLAAVGDALGKVGP